MEATDDISNSSEVGFRSFVSYCVDSGGAQALYEGRAKSEICSDRVFLRNLFTFFSVLVLYKSTL